MFKYYILNYKFIVSYIHILYYYGYRIIYIELYFTFFTSVKKI